MLHYYAIGSSIGNSGVSRLLVNCQYNMDMIKAFLSAVVVLGSFWVIIWLGCLLDTVCSAVNGL